MHSMIIIMGLPGAGKTTVLNEVVKAKPEYKIINYGTLMLEIAKQKYGIKDRDEIRTLSAQQQKEIQSEVGERLSMEKGKVILDTHCSILNPDKRFYLPGLPYTILKYLNVSMLILITGKADEIVERRAKDKTRKRAVDPKEIEEHDAINRMMLSVYAILTGAPLKIIINKNGKLEEAVKEVISILE